MSLHGDWKTAKKKAEKGGLDISVFSKGLGKKLDTFEKTYKDFEKADDKGAKNVDSLKKKAREAGQKALLQSKQYQEVLDYLSKRATSPQDKKTASDLNTRLGSVQITVGSIINRYLK